MASLPVSDSRERPKQGAPCSHARLDASSHCRDVLTRQHRVVLFSWQLQARGPYLGTVRDWAPSAQNAEQVPPRALFSPAVISSRCGLHTCRRLTSGATFWRTAELSSDFRRWGCLPSWRVTSRSRTLCRTHLSCTTDGHKVRIRIACASLCPCVSPMFLSRLRTKGMRCAHRRMPTRARSNTNLVRVLCARKHTHPMACACTHIPAHIQCAYCARAHTHPREEARRHRCARGAHPIVHRCTLTNTRREHIDAPGDAHSHAIRHKSKPPHAQAQIIARTRGNR